MKKTLFVALFTATATTVAAHQPDSLKAEKLQEVVVSGVRAQKDAPFAVANIKKQELQQFSTTGQELPFLFARTPGVLAWSENGLGTGTSYLRIRGAADSRINVTLDGVPLNSPEDQCVFWANMNSYSSLLGSVQIQRGVGTSTNGDGAFGGTVALSSKAPSTKPMLELQGSFGSYNTWNAGGQFSTGLMGHWIIDAAYHETQTDGFVNGTKGRSGSLYGGITYQSDRFQLRYKNIFNHEKTGQAWNGVTAGDDDLSLMDGTYGAPGFKTYADMYEAGLGRFNSLYQRLVHADPADNYSAFARNADGSFVTERYQLADGTVWPRAIDQFRQDHNILTAAFDLSDRWQATVSAHYTHGYGFYEEFRYQNKLKKFGLTNANVSRSDFVRKKGLTQDAYGLVGNINYTDRQWNIIGGLSAQRFDGQHWGYLTYVGNDELRQQLLALQSDRRKVDYKYYDSDARKIDANAYLKAAYRWTDAWQVFGDVQLRYIDHTSDGINDKFVAQADGSYKNQLINIDADYLFFNPKAGISYSSGPHHAYASAALSHREPERNNYTDNGSWPAPKAEQLLDFELGYSYSSRSWHLSANAYFMDYTDQFVQTGAVSDIGEKLTTNIKDSYRLGLELAAGWNICPLLSLEANAALSQNKIKDFDEIVEDWYNVQTTIHYDNSTLAFSPSLVANGFIDFHWQGLNLTWHTNYVSRQYLDNTECKERSLPWYTASDLQLSYTAKVQKVSPLKEVVLGFTMGNVFNRHYAASAWVYSAIAESSGHTNDNRYYQIGFIPMAGRTAMANLTLRF